MRLTLLSGLVTLAGLSLFSSTSQAQVASGMAIPSAAPGTYYYSNGYYYQMPMRTYYAPVYRAPVNPNGALTNRSVYGYSPTGRPHRLYKPWLNPLR